MAVAVYHVVPSLERECNVCRMKCEMPHFGMLKNFSKISIDPDQEADDCQNLMAYSSFEGITLLKIFIKILTAFLYEVASRQANPG